jgi:hypothetical protein
MTGFRWLSRFFTVRRSTTEPVAPLKLPIKHLIGTRFTIVYVNGRLESVPVPKTETLEDEKSKS